jgi:hypothetical protein
VTKLSPSITILELTNCRWKGGEGKHCGRGTLQEHWLCRLTQRRHTRTMKLNRNSPGMTVHTHTHSQGLEKIRKTSSHSSFVSLSSLSYSDCIYIYRLASSFFLMIFTLQPPSLFLLCSSWFGTRKKRTQLSLEWTSSKEIKSAGDYWALHLRGLVEHFSNLTEIKRNCLNGKLFSTNKLHLYKKKNTMCVALLPYSRAGCRDCP